MYNQPKQKQLHLLGGIGAFLAGTEGILYLIVSASYYVSSGLMILISVLGIAANALMITYLIGTFQQTGDSLIRVGCLLGAIGYGLIAFLTFLQLAGIASPAFGLFAAIVAMAGVAILCIKFIMLFQRDSLILVLCIFVLLGLLMSFFLPWADLITGCSMGALLLYFYAHNIAY